ncbi:MAG: phosphoribosylformylglycinamidine synthase subunit PurQ [Vampirovibrionales bacterium]|nr:phosphoribosylformylglycinamidine synthase subunit PurQ [Vampirovibrionales bacterium]
MTLQVGIVVFPGSNCDRDCADAVLEVLQGEVRFLPSDAPLAAHVWRGLDLIILPGGFSYGDYLRSGAIARFAPVMEGICNYAESGKLLLGICNGFQILSEAGLLPGALSHNQPSGFICNRFEALTVTNPDTPFTHAFTENERVVFPVAHGEGNYQAAPAVLDDLARQGQIVFRYAQNPNGSALDIAGICNAKRNILGLMPHPERNLWCRPQLGDSGAGRRLFESLRSALCLAS